LDWYYLDESPIPSNNPEVFRRLLARNQDEQETAVRILNEFFKLTDNGWVHGRCDKEISKFKGKSDRARDNGKRGGRPKKPTKTQPVISGLILETQKKANSLTQELINSSISPIVPAGDKKEDQVLSRLRGLFKMRASTPLDKSSENAWKAGKKIAMEATEEEWELLEWHYSQPQKYQKRSISALLNDWAKALQTAKSEMGTSPTPRKADGSFDYYADAVAVFGEENVVRVAAL
jgi:uncharacterized protein YdaU (DUF1376 family)